jgi:ribosomal protein L44E
MQIVTKNDKLVLSEEGPSSMGDCYSPTYHLSDTHTYFTYAHNVTAAPHYTGDKEAQQPQFFHGNTIINWAMFAAPRHPVYLRALQNIVEIVKSMYLRQSVVHLNRWDVKFKPIFCTTGFVLTYSIRELELEGALSPAEVPRISVNNFREYGGNVKAISTQNDPSHYRKQLKNHAPTFLTEMVPLDMEHFLQYLEGKAVMGDGGKEILLIQNGQKRQFPDYETFLKMEFTDKHTKHISDFILNQIPDGPRINKNEKIISAYSKTHVHSVLEEQRRDPSSRNKQLQRAKSAFSGAEHARMVSRLTCILKRDINLSCTPCPFWSVGKPEQRTGGTVSSECVGCHQCAGDGLLGRRLRRHARQLPAGTVRGHFAGCAGNGLSAMYRWAHFCIRTVCTLFHRHTLRILSRPLQYRHVPTGQHARLLLERYRLRKHQRRALHLRAQEVRSQHAAAARHASAAQPSPGGGPCGDALAEQRTQ